MALFRHLKEITSAIWFSNFSYLLQIMWLHASLSWCSPSDCLHPIPGVVRVIVPLHHRVQSFWLYTTLNLRFYTVEESEHSPFTHEAREVESDLAQVKRSYVYKGSWEYTQDFLNSKPKFNFFIIVNLSLRVVTFGLQTLLKTVLSKSISNSSTPRYKYLRGEL